MTHFKMTFKKIKPFVMELVTFLFGGLMLFSRVVTTGIRALIDFIFQRIREDDYVFLEERPYVATVFTEKVSHDRGRSYGMYYLLHVKKGEERYTFISPEHVEMIPNEKYRIRTGYSSKIFLESESMRG